MQPSSETEYPVIKGVELKPGVRVFCDDRDSPAFDFEGTVSSATKSGMYWRFDVVFDGQGGPGTGPSIEVLLDQIWPTDEEQNKPEAKFRRAQSELRVFLCHGSEDKESARRLFALLKQLDMQPWLDEVSIAPGADWDDAIRKAIRDSHILLALLSRRSTAKAGYVQKEIKFALDRAEEMPEGRVYIVPTLLEPCDIPARLSKWQAVRLFAPDGESRLIEALRARARELRDA